MTSENNDRLKRIETGRTLNFSRQPLYEFELARFIEPQVELTNYPFANRHSAAASARVLKADSNEDIWRYFISERLYDTRRVTLEHFHLFEWFPLSPGRFHQQDAAFWREQANRNLIVTEQGDSYYDPSGKAAMIRGGIGAVRFRPRLIGRESYYFMTASSSSDCHEGFPVLIPRRYYGQLKDRMLSDGAVPLNISGEMRYISQDDMPPSYFEGRENDLPLLYLHVDQLDELSAARDEINKFSVSVAASFVGPDTDADSTRKERLYATYASFDPAHEDGLNEACEWIKKFYVIGEYSGTIVTDFDEVRPHFSEAIFGLAPLLDGSFDQERAEDFVSTYLREASAGVYPYLRRYQNLHIHVNGDQINVGNISGSEGVAIGRGARVEIDKAGGD
jgi:hypothetical protein